MCVVLSFVFVFTFPEEVYFLCDNHEYHEFGQNNRTVLSLFFVHYNTLRKVHTYMYVMYISLNTRSKK